MLVISAADMTGLVSDIATRARAITDHNGSKALFSTMDEQNLRTAALTALMIATGEIVWPADKPLNIQRNQRPTGPLNIQE